MSEKCVFGALNFQSVTDFIGPFYLIRIYFIQVLLFWDSVSLLSKTEKDHFANLVEKKNKNKKNVADTK